MGCCDKFARRTNRISSLVFADELDGDGEGRAMTAGRRSNDGRWTWHLLGYNVAIAFGTAFIGGFTIAAFVRYTSLSPHNNAETTTIPMFFPSGEPVPTKSPYTRRCCHIFSFLQIVVFYATKLVSFLGVASLIGNKFGRRKALLSGALIGFVALLCGLISAFLPTSEMDRYMHNDFSITSSDIVWTVGIALLGLQNGIGQVVAPAYLIELAPNHRRGFSGCFYEFFFWTGFMVSYVIETEIFGTERTLWLVLIACSLFIYAAHFVAMWFTVESPRWLIHEKQDVEAKAVLQKLRQCSAEEAEAELNDIKLVAEQTGSASFSGSQPGCCDKCCCGSKLFSAKVMWPVFLGSCLMSANYLTGAPLVYQFQTAILKKENDFVSRSNNDFVPEVAIGLSVVYLAIMAGCALTVDRIGRRRLVILGLTIMTISYVPVAIGVYLGYSIAWKIGSVFLMAAFAFGPGPIATFMVGELFDQSTRLSATGICHLVTQLFPVIWLELYSHTNFSVNYADLFLPGGILFSVIEVVLLCLLLPETTKIPIERVVEKFEPGRRRLQLPVRRRRSNNAHEMAQTNADNAALSDLAVGNFESAENA